MNMIIRYYNQNRRKILIFILVIVSVIMLLQLLNNITKERNKREYEHKYNEYLNKENSNVLLESNNLQSSGDVSSDSNVNKTQYNIINKFVEYCNNNQIKDAYNMVSDGCRRNLFPTINDFKNNYVDKIFYEEKVAKIEDSYYENGIFKVTYSNNPLISGGYITEKTMQDYVYIVKEQDEYKLSLNKYLYESEINKTEKTNDISILILKKEVYIDYEEYQIQIINNSDKTIQIVSESSNLYLLDKYENKCVSDIGNLLAESLTISAKEMTTLNVTFYKTYNKKNESKNCIFEEVILNYDEYLSGTEKQTIKITVSL